MARQREDQALQVLAELGDAVGGVANEVSRKAAKRAGRGPCLDRSGLRDSLPRTGQPRILAFWLSNSWAVITPRSRRSASLANWSAVLGSPAASWT